MRSAQQPPDTASLDLTGDLLAPADQALMIVIN
jgi:hypothetical protein